MTTTTYMAADGTIYNTYASLTVTGMYLSLMPDQKATWLYLPTGVAEQTLITLITSEGESVLSPDQRVFLNQTQPFLLKL